MINKIIEDIYEKLLPVLETGTVVKYKPTTQKEVESKRQHVIYAATNNEVMKSLGNCTIYEHTINITSVSGKAEESKLVLEDVALIIDALEYQYPKTVDNVRIMECRHTGNGANKLETGTLRHFNTIEFVVRYRRV